MNNTKNTVKLFTATVVATVAMRQRILMRTATQSVTYTACKATLLHALHAVAFRILLRNNNDPSIAPNCTLAHPWATVLATIGGVA